MPRRRSNKRAGRVPPPRRDGSALCLQCGMCCDGTLFAHAALGEDEVDLARSHSMEPFRVGGALKFHLPCPEFRDGACSVYLEDKPAVCGGYRCRLLVGYTDRSRSLDECLDVIGWMQGLTRELEEEMAVPAGSFTFTKLFEQLIASRPHEHPERFARFLLAADRYLALNHEHFGLSYDNVADVVAAGDAAGANPAADVG